MKYVILAPVLALSLNAVAAQQGAVLPSCDLQQQREVVGETGGQISDRRTFQCEPMYSLPISVAQGNPARSLRLKRNVLANV
ncbi:hypothetical protein SJI00_14060 [Pseudomonas sp. RP23018S]|uniref:hypothetical protein n=1 Tax=Pseudomonas sp. RP23018S TaxID=3096037 RepID=UPI002ACAE444|nr:hypothetical protein [Pseudomonas sp. RP23018S]MDZ5603901.1 hypothetical protein [Pseudomonas sp. RP23018S]